MSRVIVIRDLDFPKLEESLVAVVELKEGMTGEDFFEGWLKEQAANIGEPWESLTESFDWGVIELLKAS